MLMSFIETLDFALRLLFLELGFGGNPFVNQSFEFLRFHCDFGRLTFVCETINDKSFLRTDIPIAVIAGTFDMFFLLGENLFN